ncbi:MAG: NAD(P)(+) transhydrogenase (Re/Si-specific) subunit beta [Planctomycetes bacterium]|nr:NAD(P)(+) transhydrogenase (Re/Si-specific) subunit beta [Planctomycetota bacterium]MCB9890930.1 NAD(P)(+) transhydrogenase (Re/Si-specific) subunit beta [Planctomycetota bacterium]
MIYHLLYLLAAALFIFGLKRLSKVKTSRQGNLLAAAGMFLAILVTLLDTASLSWGWIIAGLVIGSAIGAYAAQTVQMTAMPQMVAIFNGFGGIASALVALSTFLPHASRYTEPMSTGGTIPTVDGLTVMLSILVGGVTFSGSMIAFAKLQELMPGKPILFQGQNATNFGLIGVAVLLIVLSVFVVSGGGALTTLTILLTILSLGLGVLLVIPIGGADMPVVISLLNSYSGIAASMAGFVIGNQMLIVSGALVGASGLILTNIMCKAMNRSLANVMFGGFGADSTTGGDSGKEGYTNVKSFGAEEAAMLFETAQLVIVVPGYGLAVAQAQHQVRELAELLEKRGCKVLYAIHPVAGRMPGHMNVLLAEANIPYESLIEMDDINPEFKNADISLILGANDVVNPAAKKDKSSPIWGMPVLNVEESRTVMVVKRSLSPGFAGIRNELFEMDNTMMLFGDAKKMLQQLIEELKQA